MSVRDRILSAGVGLLKAEGIAALTQPRIARAAGVSQSHLTYYFPTRNRLLLAIAEQSIEGVLESVHLPAEATGSASLAERLGALIGELPQVRVVLGLIVAADREPELREALRAFVERMRARIATLLAREGAGPSAEHALVFHATVVGLAVMNLARQSEASRAEIGQGLAALLGFFAAAGAAGGPR
jgi:AcrR family transcriptional regulator